LKALYLKEGKEPAAPTGLLAFPSLRKDSVQGTFTRWLNINLVFEIYSAAVASMDRYVTVVCQPRNSMLRHCNKKMSQKTATTLQLGLFFPSQYPAQDTPDTDLCQSVPARDRLPCAPSAVSRGDCEELGCCYSSEDKDRTYCYYGNTGERGTSLGDQLRKETYCD
jgi:hypothetical protein